MNRLHALQDAGVSIWLDTLSRELLDSGELRRLIADYAVTGATSNPTIFAKALAGSDRYDRQLRACARAGVHDPRELFFTLALDDVGRAADLLLPVYDASGGRDGFVSFECTPDLADDTAGTVEQALELWHRLARPNVMIKVPATAAGVPAIEALIAGGVNVNVTLLFSVARYDEVIDAYLRGLEHRVAVGEPVATVASVASFFVSRVDAVADAQLPAGSDLRGRVAIANAELAYGRYRTRFAGERWDALHAAGARPQRPLWASTGTKDPAYSDVLYVERLIAPGSVNTMPAATLRAFADHGRVTETLDGATEAAEAVLRTAAAAGIELASVTEQLQHDGVAAFCASYRELLASIEGGLAQKPNTSDARFEVLVTGGGPAAAEAALVLERLAADRVQTTIVAPDTRFVRLPPTVLSPFAVAERDRFSLEGLTGARVCRGSLSSVDAEARRATLADGRVIEYDALLVAVGGLPRTPYPHALAFGIPGSEDRMHGLIQDLEDGYVRRVAFVVPPGASWPLPVYELALAMAERAYDVCATVELTLLTPEPSPLAVFGRALSDDVAQLLATAGIVVRCGVQVEMPSRRRLDLRPSEDVLDVDRVVTLPVLTGPAIEGLPHDGQGFLPVDAHGRVVGVDGVFAAGDVTDFEIKQGGIACQQADAAAEAIAAEAGAAIDPTSFTPLLRGVLVTEHDTRRLGDEDATEPDRLRSKLTGRELSSRFRDLAGRS